MEKYDLKSQNLTALNHIAKGKRLLRLLANVRVKKRGTGFRIVLKVLRSQVLLFYSVIGQENGILAGWVSQKKNSFIHMFLDLYIFLNSLQ